MITTKDMHVQMQDEMMSMIHQVENGELGHLDALIRMEEERKSLEQTLAIAKSFKDTYFDQIEEASKEHPEGFKGWDIEIRNGGRTFKYNHIPEWDSLKKQMKECEEVHKQAFISKEKGMLTATEDGEEIVLPEVSYRKSSIILKQKK